MLRTGVQLNGDGLDPAHGLVAQAAARVVRVPPVVVRVFDNNYRGGAAPRLVLQRHSACRFKLILKCSVLSLHSLDALAFTV